MNAIEGISSAIRSSLCADIDVSPVPLGYAVTTAFLLPDGDPLAFYVVNDDDGRVHLEDDGTFLPGAIASGLDIKSGVREHLLRGILAEENAGYDVDDLIIRSDPVEDSDIGSSALHFISALIRMRDIALLSRENVRETFADDVRGALRELLPETFVLDDPDTASPFEPDLIVRNKSTGLRTALIFAAGNDLRMVEAVLRHTARGAGDAPVVAVVDRRRGRVSERRFNAATNWGVPLAVVEGHDTKWVGRVIDIATDADKRAPAA